MFTHQKVQYQLPLKKELKKIKDWFMKIDFTHKQTAHCENGVVSNLMTFNGFPVSEPMVFGIGSGL